MTLAAFTDITNVKLRLANSTRLDMGFFL
ncbi:hypothetical protein [Legionella donaldsonii]